MKFALILNGIVQSEASEADAELVDHDGSPLFDIRDVSGVEGIAPGWVAGKNGNFSAPTAPKVPVPDRCSKLGLKRALSETGPDAVFSKSEWPLVKAAIEADEDRKEEWDLATVLVRTDPLVQAMIAVREYDAKTVDKILVRANALVS